jgi:flagella basal body P-ring formation protein FlgA
MRNSKIVILVFVGLLAFAAMSIALENPEAKLAKLIKDHVLSKRPEWGELDIQVTLKYADKTLASLEQLPADTGLKIVEVYKDVKPVGNVIFPIEVSSGRRIRKIFLRTKVEVFKVVVVSKHYIPRGEVVKDENLRLMKRDIAMIPEKYFDKIEYVAGTETKTSIPENSTLFSWMIKEVPLVHRGDKVMVRIVAPNLLLKTEGVALEDGYIGTEMKVKRKGIKNPVEGVLVSSNVVEVRLR